MSDYITRQSNFIAWFRFNVGDLRIKFQAKYGIHADHLFLSNGMYWDLRREIDKQQKTTEQLSLMMHSKTFYKKIMGLNIRILDACEGDDELYVGVIEE